MQGSHASQSSERVVPGVIRSATTVVLMLCVKACAPLSLQHALRLLRHRSAGAWNGDAVVLTDAANEAAVAAVADGYFALHLVLPSAAIDVPVLRNVNGHGDHVSKLAEPVATLAEHFGVVRAKTMILQLPELQRYETLIMIDVDALPVRGISTLLASVALLMHGASIGMARDCAESHTSHPASRPRGCNVYNSGVMVVRRSALAKTCLDEWRRQMNVSWEAIAALRAGKKGECAATSRWRPLHGLYNCFKDQTALDRAARSSLCTRALAPLPQVSLTWTWKLQQKQLPLGGLLAEPQAEAQLLDAYARKQQAPAIHFVHFNRYERLIVDPSKMWTWVTSTTHEQAKVSLAAIAAADQRSAMPEGPTSGWWLRHAAGAGARGGQVLRLIEPRRNHDCAVLDGVLTLVAGRYAESLELITLSTKGDGSDGSSPIAVAGVRAVHEPSVPQFVLDASFKLGKVGPHPLGQRLLDINHAQHVALLPLGEPNSAARELWLMCGFYDPTVSREESVSHVVIIDSRTMLPRLGPKLPHGGGACNALPIHADGYAKPALPCAFGGTRGNHDTGQFLDTVQCYDRASGRWRKDAFSRLPVAFDHGNAVLMRPGACGAGSPGRVLILNTRSTHYDNLASGRRSEVYAHDLDADGRPLCNEGNAIKIANMGRHASDISQGPDGSSGLCRQPDRSAGSDRLFQT